MQEVTDIRDRWAVVLRRKRLERLLTQEDVARLTGLDQTTVSQAERGKGGIQAYQSIAVALEVEL